MEAKKIQNLQDDLEKKKLISEIKQAIKAQETHDAQKNQIRKQKKLEADKTNKKEKQLKEGRLEMYFGLIKDIHQKGMNREKLVHYGAISEIRKSIERNKKKKKSKIKRTM